MDHAPTQLPRFTNLFDDQADGLACVVCRTDLQTGSPRRTVPVGRSVTGSLVMACLPPFPCAAQLGHKPAEVTT